MEDTIKVTLISVDEYEDLKRRAVSREVLEGLVNSLDLNIWALKNGAVISVIGSLKQLKDDIEANLRGNM